MSITNEEDEDLTEQEILEVYKKKGFRPPREGEKGCHIHLEIKGQTYYRRVVFTDEMLNIIRNY